MRIPNVARAGAVSSSRGGRLCVVGECRHRPRRSRASLPMGTSSRRHHQQQPLPCTTDENAHPPAPIRPARLPATRSVTHAPACRLRAEQHIARAPVVPTAPLKDPLAATSSRDAATPLCLRSPHEPNLVTLFAGLLIAALSPVALGAPPASSAALARPAPSVHPCRRPISRRGCRAASRCASPSTTIMQPRPACRAPISAPTARPARPAA